MPKCAAQILGRVTGAEPKGTAPGWAQALHSLSLGHSSSAGCPRLPARPPKGTMHGRAVEGPIQSVLKHTQGAASALVCYSTSSCCSVPPARGYLTPPLRYLLSLLSRVLMMSVGIDALNSEFSNTVCQRLRETPVQADQNSLALFSITNSTAK